MQTIMIRPQVTGFQVGMTVVLLIGVLLLAYGWFHLSKTGLYGGLLVTGAGVLVGVVDLVTHVALRYRHR